MKTTYRTAVHDALRDALRDDPRVMLMGEDVGRYGGTYAASKGLLDEFGPDRVRDTPLSELGFVGIGIGAALGGLRPIVEVMTVNFSLLALDQVVNTAAALRHMSGGQFSVPLVIRMATGAGRQLAAQHSHSLEPWYAHIPGIKVVAPATVADAYGMLGTALADPDPVVIFEHVQLYNAASDVAAFAPTDIARAAVRRDGSDATVIAYGGSLPKALDAANELSLAGIECEVIDLRVLRPLDTEAILQSVRKTHRAVVVDEAWRTGSLAAEISARIVEVCGRGDPPAAMRFGSRADRCRRCGGGACFGALRGGLGWWCGFAGFHERCQHRSHRHGLADRDQQLVDHALVPAFDLHGRLRGFHHRDDLSFRHGVARLDQPFVERALVHVRAECWHLELDHALGPNRLCNGGDDLVRLRQRGLFEMRWRRASALPRCRPGQSERPGRRTPGRLADSLGIDVSAVSGTGPQGAVTIHDVEHAAASAKQSPAKRTMADRAAAMRGSIAAAMSRSKREIPHYYLVHEIALDNALAWLAERNAQRPITERLLPAVLQLKAVGLAARQFGEFNGFWQGDTFQPARGVHLGVAISLRAGGLIAPAIHDVPDKKLDDLMSDLTDLVARARAGSLRSSEMSDPTITVTNLGDRGVDAVFGVIYPPQVALVGFGKPAQRVRVVDGGIRVLTTVHATLSADHRATDGHRGALFLAAIDELLQRPHDLEK